MTRFQLFFIRAILGLFFAVVLTRIFYGRTDPFYVAGLTIIIVGLAYVAEYFRLRRTQGPNPPHQG